MASAMVRHFIYRASCVAQASGALAYSSSSSRCWARNQHGKQCGVMRVLGREFSRVKRVGGTRGPVAIAAASKRRVAVALKERVEDEREKEDEDEDEYGKETIGRNASKKQSARAREWGRELATLSPVQLRQACRWASVDEDVYDAIMLVKNLGTSHKVKHGRRRQYNYIGGLLRDVDPEIMETVLKATKDGDSSAFTPSNQPDDVNDRFKDVSEDEEAQEEDDGSLEQAETWLEGLVAGDRAVEDEVYTIYDVDFDRQELRKLVREARKYEIQSTATSDAGGAEAAEGGQELPEAEILALRSKGERARKMLSQVLLEIVKEKRNNAYDSVL